MCDEAVKDNTWSLYDVPDHFKTQDMCERAVEDEPKTLQYVLDHLKTQEMCNEAVGIDPWSLYDVPYQLKKEKMCDKAVKDDHYSLQFVPGFSQGSGQICGVIMIIGLTVVLLLNGLMGIKKEDPRKGKNFYQSLGTYQGTRIVRR